MKKCPYCNTLNPDDAEVCKNCGKPLKGRMLALVCPNCGKVNALGSRECSVCHTKLSQSNHQLVSREITSRKNNKRWGYIALIAFGILIALFTYLGGRYARNIFVPGKIEALEFKYYDECHHLIRSDYYVVRSTGNLSQTRFKVAYIGRNSEGKNQLRLATTKSVKRLYRENKHYIYDTKNQDVIISGPHKVIIKGGAKMIATKFGTSRKIAPSFKPYRCKMTGNKRADSVKIYILNIIDKA